MEIKEIIEKGINCSDIFESVKTEICNNYCKHPAECTYAGITDESELESICDKCPLGAL